MNEIYSNQKKKKNKKRVAEKIEWKKIGTVGESQRICFSFLASDGLDVS